MGPAAKEIINGTLGKFGLRLMRVKSIPKPQYGCPTCFFPLLKRLGFAPKRVIDVGANHGNWTRAAIEFFPEAEYTLVEPQGHLKSNVEDLIAEGYRIKWIEAGASDAAGEMRLTIGKKDNASTFGYTEDGARSLGLEQKMVQVKTLNEIAGGGAAPEMVKIDAEGFDLKVLDGASELLGKTEVFLLEASLAGWWKNTVGEEIKRMAEEGYRLMDITDFERSPRNGMLWLCELAFVREDSRMLEGMSYE